MEGEAEEGEAEEGPLCSQRAPSEGSARAGEGAWLGRAQAGEAAF